MMLNGRETTEREKIIIELRKDEKLEDHFDSLISCCRNDRLVLVQSSSFFLRNCLGSINDQLVLMAAAFEVCLQDKLATPARSLWSSIRHSPSPLPIFAHHLLLQEGFSKTSKIRKSAIEIYARSLPTTETDLLAVDGFLDKLNDEGPLPFRELVYLAPPVRPVYIDNFRSTKEGLKRTEGLGGEGVGYVPEMLIPLPTPVGPTADEFLCPFPFIVEMPALNVSTEVEKILPELLDNIGNSDPGRIKVS